MDRIKRVLALIHIVPWTIAILIGAWDVLIESQPLRPKGFLVGFYVFYAHLFIFKKYLNKRDYKPYIWYLLVVILTGPFPFLLFRFLGKENISSWMDFLVTYVDAISLAFPFIIISSLAGIVNNLIINTLKNEQLQKQAVISELDYLKSQINPHFLFNTLNNIHTLVYTQAPAAPEAVMRLSSLMRYMIYESNSTTVPLTIEIEYLQDYISLQQLRYESSSVVDFRVEGDIEKCQVAPLLFIHILENSYKHSPPGLNPGSIKVKVTVNGSLLIVSFQNPLGKMRVNLLEEPGGIGLVNVKKRLHLLYPNQYSLDINQTDDIFHIELKINFQQQTNERKTNLLYN